MPRKATLPPRASITTTTCRFMAARRAQRGAFYAGMPPRAKPGAPSVAVTMAEKYSAATGIIISLARIGREERNGRTRRGEFRSGRSWRSSGVRGCRLRRGSFGQHGVADCFGRRRTERRGYHERPCRHGRNDGRRGRRLCGIACRGCRGCSLGWLQGVQMVAR